MTAKPKATKPNATVDLTPGRCTCGCGEPTRGKSLWRPGHDQRAKGQLKRAHLAGQRVTVAEGKTRRQVPALRGRRPARHRPLQLVGRPDPAPGRRGHGSPSAKRSPLISYSASPFSASATSGA